MAGPYDPSMGMDAPPTGVDPNTWSQLGPNARRALVERMNPAPATTSDLIGSVLPPSVARPAAALAAVPEGLQEMAAENRQAQGMPNPNPLPAPPGSAQALMDERAARARAAVAQENAQRPPPPPAAAPRPMPMSGAVPGQAPLPTRATPPPGQGGGLLSRFGGSVAKIQEDAEGNPVPYNKQAEEAAAGGGEPLFVSPPAAPAPKPVTIPAHNQPLVDPLIQQELFDAYGNQRDATGRRADAARDAGISRALKSDMVAEGLGAEGQKLHEMEAETRKNAEERDKTLADFRSKIDDYSKKVSEREIDPQKAWHDMDVPGKIFTGLSVAIGGFLMGSGRTQRNVYLDRLDALNAASAVAQMKNYEIKKGRVDDMNNLYAQAYKATGDKQEALRLAMGYGYEEMKKMTEQIAASADSPIARSNAEEVAAELGERQAQLGVAEKKDKVAMNKWVPAATVGGAGGGSGKKDEGLIFRGVDGKFYQGRNKESRDLLAKANAANADLQNHGKQYIADLKGLTASDIALAKIGVHTENFQKASTTYGLYQDAARKTANMGTPQKGEIEELQKRIPPPDQISGNPAAAIAAMNVAGRSTLQTLMQAESPLPVNEEVAPTGPTREFQGSHYQAPPSKTPGFVPVGPKK